ncbi:MAG: flagellar filament capping protein FliD [Candidatus Hydrogenedentes bacterium]|nr:flagellar filament capping protein FliD [Candidatus Hydrogenedentota bacterium]
MSGSISAGGLITGLDSNALIQQLLSLERQPVIRFEDRITALEAQKTAVTAVRTALQGLRNRAQDFRLFGVFDAYTSTSSKPEVLTSEVSSPNPVLGAFDINVTQLATATRATSSSKLSASIDPAANLDSSGITDDIEGGTFSINGVQFNVDPATQSLNTILGQINGSAAGVTATYDSLTDRITIANTTPGDTSLINFEDEDDTSNFLDAIGVTGATQLPGGGGATQATSTRILGATDAAAVINTGNYAGGAITAGSFSINGVSITIDPTTDSISDIVERINSSGAKVTASLDATTDTLLFTSKTLGSPTIKFGAVGDTSNFISVANLSAATQTAGADAQFTVNGGAVQTRNTNTVSDAVSGVTLRLLSVGSSTVGVSSDDDAVVEDVRAFIDEFNKTVTELRDITSSTGALAGDGSIRSIESFLRSNVFSQIAGVGNDFLSLVDIGITTGKDFNSTVGSTLELDEDVLREALRTNRSNVEGLFSNTAKDGVADTLFAFLDDAVSFSGYLNGRAKANGSIDQQIESVRAQIERLDERLATREARLRRQFTQLETLSSSLQSQAGSLSGLRSF